MGVQRSYNLLSVESMSSTGEGCRKNMSRSGNVARGRPTVNTFNLHENYMMLSEPEERRIKRAVDAPRLVGRPMRLVITSRFLCFPIMSAARHVARRAASYFTLGDAGSFKEFRLGWGLGPPFTSSPLLLEISSKWPLRMAPGSRLTLEMRRNVAVRKGDFYLASVYITRPSCFCADNSV